MAGAESLAFGGHIHGGLRGAGRFQRDLHGKTFAAENLAGKGNRIEQQAGLGTAGQRLRYRWGCRGCCACQMARAALPRFSLPSEISSRRGTMPAGSEATPSRMAVSKSVPCPAGAGRVTQRPSHSWMLVEGGAAGHAGKGDDASQWRPRARSTRSASADSVRRSSARCWRRYRPAWRRRPWSDRRSCAAWPARDNGQKRSGLQQQSGAASREAPFPCRPGEREDEPD